MRVHVVDPPAYTPPYDHALCAALARAGADVELITSRFGYGPVPVAQGYAVRESFYRFAPGAPGSRLRRAARLAQHVPDMVRARRHDRTADVVHYQWLAVPQVDARLIARGRPTLITAHDVLPRDAPASRRDAQRRLYDAVDAIVVHSEHGRDRLVDELGLGAARVHVIRHGALEHLTQQRERVDLPAELARVDVPVVLCFGLVRPYKGIDVLLDAWRGIEDAELWVVGLPKMDISGLRAAAPPSVRFVDRFVTDPEIPAFFERADLVVLPYREIDQSGVLFTALAFGKPMLLTAVGGFPEVGALGAAEIVAPADAVALHEGLLRLLADPAARAELAAGSARAARETYGWDAIAQRTLELYRSLSPG